MSVSVFAKNTCTHTGEGPFWEEHSKSLVYVDIGNGDVHKWSTITDQDSKIHFGGNVSFVIPRSSGGYVIGHDQSIEVFDWDKASTTDHAHAIATSIAKVDQGTKNRLNDAKCDASGRLWAGTMGYEPQPAKVEPKMGSLFSLSRDHIVKNHRDKVDLSNGLAWTADNRTMFFIDSIPRKVYAFDFDLESGNISNERTAIDFGEGTLSTLGYPDGMTIDLDGKIWIACYSVGKVIRYDPETAQQLQTIHFPDAMATTSCCWGGQNYDELYVTSSGRNVTTAEQRAKEPYAGSVFKVTGLGVKGSAATTFNG